jgi:hypothetical protein
MGVDFLFGGRHAVGRTLSGAEEKVAFGVTDVGLEVVMGSPSR